tara:strand:+ start:608 stop:1072 length:465 start_codon:yes stop_codon:yes gene_type:complete
MFIYQYILLLGFAGLYFNKETKMAASAFLIGWAVYIAFALGTKFEQYFILSAVIELAIAYALNNKYKNVSYVSYLLILVNVAGLILHINGIKDYYNHIYAVLSTYQFSLLLIKLVPNGIYRRPIQCNAFCDSNYDCGQARVKVHKNTTADNQQK